ncbi:MAG: hypothetical protein F6K09_36095, partial [Merismopedia sp. SIO2A8]|nr:hypothetical protein [Merismopedia sp. SIO2A8]
MIKKLAWLNCGVTALGLVTPALALETSVGEARKNGRKIGICGQAPSDYPEFA